MGRFSFVLFDLRNFMVNEFSPRVLEVLLKESNVLKLLLVCIRCVVESKYFFIFIY